MFREVRHPPVSWYPFFKICMKYLIKNGRIIQTGLPEIFTRPDGELFYGGYASRTDLHYQDGWRDEAVPKYDPKMQMLGQPEYDPERDVVTYRVINLAIDTGRLLEGRLQEFEAFQKEFRREITELYLEEIALGELPAGVLELIRQLKVRREEIYEELQSFAREQNLERLLNYSFHTEETQQYKQMLRALKNDTGNVL